MKKATVVGAGLVGSLWAMLLAKRGYAVDVFERRDDFRKASFVGGRSINLAMSDRGWRALEKAGIADAIRAEGIPMKGRMMHSPKGELTFQPYGKEGQAIYSVSRGGLNKQLVQAADAFEQVHFHFNTPCAGYDMATQEVLFQSEGAAEPHRHHAPLVFGSDGAFSALRNDLQKRARFDYEQKFLPHGYKELSIPPTPDGDFAMELNALHIWPRGAFMLIALPNPDKSFTCTLFLPFEGEVSFEQLQDEASIMAFFEKYFADTIPLMPDLLEEFQENPNAPLVTIRCAPWNYKNTLLLGDASHAIVPFYGQGMNSGFEDCSILDDMVDEYGEDWKRIFEQFGKNRPKDANAIADFALRNFVEMRDQVADPKFLLRKKIAQHFHEKYGNRFLPMYSLVTFSHTPYSEAWAASQAQDALFEEILALPDIEENWKSPKVEALFENWLQEQESLAV